MVYWKFAKCFFLKVFLIVWNDFSEFLSLLSKRALCPFSLSLCALLIQADLLRHVRVMLSLNLQSIKIAIGLFMANWTQLKITENLRHKSEMTSYLLHGNLTKNVTVFRCLSHFEIKTHIFGKISLSWFVLQDFQKQIGSIVFFWPNHSGNIFLVKFGFLWKLFFLPLWN